jgi:hypothetical protein
MAGYQAEMTKYRAASQAWSAMSGAERQRAHKAEEASRLGLFSAGLGALIGAGVWGVINQRQHLDGLYACAMAAAGAAVFYLIPTLRSLTGHLARTIVMAVVYGFFSTIIVGFLSGASAYVALHLETAKVVGILIAVVAAGVAEVAGLHHAKATPREPKAPRP